MGLAGAPLVPSSRHAPLLFPSPRSGASSAAFGIGRWNALGAKRVVEGRGARRREAAMLRTVLPSLWLVASLCGSAVATESQHSVVVDKPEVITLTHAAPDTWHTLPPVQQNEPTSTAASHPRGPLVFVQLARLQLRCDAHSTHVSQNSLSVVESF